MPAFAAIRQDEYPATDELQCIAVHIPEGDEYKALLAGFIAFLCDVASYEDPESAQADGIAAVFDEGYAQTNWDGCGVPPECEMSATSLIVTLDNAIITSGGAMAWTASATQMYGGGWSQTGAATADQWRMQRYLAAGDWEFEILGVRTSASGKGTFYITVDFSTFQLSQNVDFFGTALSNYKITGSFTIPEAGLYTIGLDGTGRTNPSTGFTRLISKIEMWKYQD